MTVGRSVCRFVRLSDKVQDSRMSDRHNITIILCDLRCRQACTRPGQTRQFRDFSPWRLFTFTDPGPQVRGLDHSGASGAAGAGWLVFWLAALLGLTSGGSSFAAHQAQQPKPALNSGLDMLPSTPAVGHGSVRAQTKVCSGLILSISSSWHVMRAGCAARAGRSPMSHEHGGQCTQPDLVQRTLFTLNAGC